MGGWLGDTLAMYGRVFRRAAELLGRNWQVALLAAAYLVALAALGGVLAPFGLVGGLVWTTARAAACGSWLVFVEQVVRSGRANLGDLPSSFGAYFGDMLNIFFLLFLGQVALLQFPFLFILFLLAALVFLNAVPELVYLGRFSTMELLAESYRFIGTNWIEWFPPNLALLVVLAAVHAVLPPAPLGLVRAAGVGLVLAFLFIMRGLLFLELTTSSRRAREFRRRAAG
jgi:hypothetical protein